MASKFNHINIVQKMTDQARYWEERQDKRAVFLQCYTMMSANMLDALKAQRFQDNAWVERLLHRFADYYFDALACYDCGEEVPLVWQNVHEAAAHNKLHVLQHLLLGVNAHINYDLVLTLEEILRDEWFDLSEEMRKKRYQDHCMVNTIIAETIDKVQDDVIEEYSPIMDLVDKVFGRQDERIFISLISSWREHVWENALKLIECTDDVKRKYHLNKLENAVLRRSRWLELGI
jgi:hypothetical protein